ncbi:MAG: choice-of-anchor J domain-containing protein [Chitinophagaceae bacterium]
MKNKCIVPLSLVLTFTFCITACIKDEKAVTDNRPPVVSASWSEEFDDVGKLGSKGWVITNNSDKVGPEAWRQGRYESTNKATFGLDYVVGFPAYSASKSPNDFISCDFYAGAAVANMSVWLISPPTKMKNGDQIIFYTRDAIDDGSFNLKDGTDRVQVRANLATTSTFTGKDWTGVGDFNSLLLDINAGLAFGGYPTEWTKYTITLSGITGTVSGRFAFRYFVSEGGPDGLNAGEVGIDALSFISK